MDKYTEEHEKRMVEERAAIKRDQARRDELISDRAMPEEIAALHPTPLSWSRPAASFEPRRPNVSGIPDFSLDRDWLPTCTPERRASLIGDVPETVLQYARLGLSANPNISARVCEDWLRRRLTLPPGDGNPPGLILFSPESGTGKSTLMVALLRALAEAGVGDRFTWNVGPEPEEDREGCEVPMPYPVSYQFWPRLAEGFNRNDFDRDPWLTTIDRLSAVGLDEVTVLGEATERRVRFLQAHLEWVDLKPGRSLIVTTNAQPEQWLGKFGEYCSDRMLDARLFRRVRVRGGSLRPANVEDVVRVVQPAAPAPQDGADDPLLG